MSAVALDLLAEARRHGIRLTPTPTGTLKACAPKPPPPDLLAKLKAHRAELIAALAQPDADDFGERAAIIEEGAHAPRSWAEALARLNPDCAPGDVPLRRWRLFMDDAGRFLDGGWAERANALGWQALDLFGCDRERPFARIDRAGLLWLLKGDKLVALSADGAAIERGRVRQTYRRRPIETGNVVLAWELVP